MTSTTTGVTFGTVSVGDKLPELSVKVTPTTVVLGALASRDWRPMHHDYKFATERNGVADIFLNTPNQAAWFERFVTDWTGPRGRLGRMKFRMKTSVFPDDLMVLTGTVTSVDTDESGCGWVTIDVALRVGEVVASTCDVRVALPVDDNDNPWERKGERWNP